MSKLYGDFNGIAAQYDACYYEIALETGEVKVGNLTLKMKQVSNVNVFMSSGSSLDDITHNY